MKVQKSGVPHFQVLLSTIFYLQNFQTDDETHKAQVYYAKVPPDVHRRNVLLMYPILTHGITVIEAVKVKGLKI